MPLPTPAQQIAIEAQGNVLVQAAAGSGKTSTLVQRCLARILAATDPVPVDRMLLVTFTEAAAAEMRARLRAALLERHAAAPDNRWIQEQLALLDAAPIGTLHSFCLQLVRQHFFVLGLDPQLIVLDEAEARILAEEVLDQLLRQHYAREDLFDQAVQALLRQRNGGWDGPIRQLVLRLHAYGQSLPDPECWFREQQALFESPQPRDWLPWLLDGIAQWRNEWLGILENGALNLGNLLACRQALRDLGDPFTRAQAAQTCARILSGYEDWPTKAARKPFEKFFEEAAFLKSLAECGDGGIDPLVQDWEWVRGQMTTLLEFTREFSAAFAAAKREMGAVDFQDLEQFALALLRDRTTGQLTEIAQQWRDRLQFIFVDEYQDINAAQDQIITALGASAPSGNRFLVGDVKQSIYRFRLADPRIFQQYAREWLQPHGAGQVLPLSENFRSHEALLDVVNLVCSALFRSEIGGVDYPASARLVVGSPETREDWMRTTDPAPRVEVHLCLDGDDEDEDDTEEALDDLNSAEKEARMVALRVRALKESGLLIRRGGERKPVSFGDIVILLRSLRSKAEIFAKEFARLGVPLAVERGGFFDSLEITDLLSLLQVLDNPLQDIPLVATLRSPLVGLTSDELAVVRLAQRKGRYWWAMRRFHREFEALVVAGSDDSIRAAMNSARPKVAAFLQSYARWRELSRQGALSHCLETVLDETQYEAWLEAQPRGTQQSANVQRLLRLTRQFDQFQRQGLFRFLNYVQAQQEAALEGEPAAFDATDAVRLMSVHRSKGLEFPVVVFGGLGTRFNLSDLASEIILDPQYGLCPKIQPPHTGQRYPSLPHWLAARRQRRETIGEEIRLLYVAMTRASERLLLTGTASGRRAKASWSREATHLTAVQIVAANQFLDLLGPLLPQLTGTPDWIEHGHGKSALVSWQIWRDKDLSVELSANATMPVELIEDPASIPQLLEPFSWKYPFNWAVREPAKTSVTVLRRRWMESFEEDARILFDFTRRRKAGGPAARKKQGMPASSRPDEAEPGMETSAAEIGTLHHEFLQRIDLAQLASIQELQHQAEKLHHAGVFTAEEIALLDLDAVGHFWNSDPGREILQQADSIHRELAFTARFSRAELDQLSRIAFSIPGASTNISPLPNPGGAEEFVVVQGVVDLAVILPEAIWVLDFKTDDVHGEALEERVRMYASQIQLYALALERIYRRPVARCWLHFQAAKNTFHVAPLSASKEHMAP
jgi:ATP-dependent helicase/nuclease subunit A